MLLQDYVHEFVGMVRWHLFQHEQALIQEGQRHFLAAPPGERVGWLLRARAPLRLAIGLRGKPDLIPQTFHPDAREPVVVFLTADLLLRFPAALDKLALPPPPPAATAMDNLRVMKLLHMLMDLAEESQLMEYLPTPSTPPQWR